MFAEPTISAVPASSHSAWLVASLDYGRRDDRLAVFPFPHRLQLELRLSDGALSVATTVEATVALSDIVKASDEDLEALYPGESEDDAAARLLALGPAAVVVTRGAEGAVWYSATLRVSDPGVPVHVADTIGAGDTFGAAMLDELGTRGLLGGGVTAIGSMTREDVAGVLAFATRAAAVTVSRPGADPPYRSEL